jgi:hypothetical protein
MQIRGSRIDGMAFTILNERSDPELRLVASHKASVRGGGDVKPSRVVRRGRAD